MPQLTGSWVCILLALTVLCCAPVARAETVFGYEPELYFKSIYPEHKGHKAMAIGPGGLRLVRWGMNSAAAAQKMVLRDCQREVNRLGWTKAGKCELVAVDERLVWSGPASGPPVGVPLPQPDGPLNKAKIFASQHRGQPKGIVLALHGSENNYGVSSAPHSFQKSWFDYFNSIGL